MSIHYGYTLSSEEHGPRELVEHAHRAETAGFDFLSVSDHFHPWTRAQGHSPFVWTVLGAIAQSTDRIQVGVGVTCPIIRIHPAVLAQATATTSLLLEGRFFWGVGTGEALNEHIVGRRWPPPEVRLEMLEEAIQIVRALWGGEVVDHRGTHYEVDNARIFDPPVDDIPIVVSGFGPQAAEVAGRIGDGYWGNAPEAGLVKAFVDAGGDGPRYAQINLCWAQDVDRATKTVHEIWPTGGLSGQLSQDLPTWTHFEQATEPLTVDQVTEHTPCGPDIADEVVDVAQQYLDAGYDHLYFHQIGHDQQGFLEYWEHDLKGRLPPKQ